MNVIVRAPLVHQCPHVDEVDVGRVELTFWGEAPELHTLRKHLESYATRALSHEHVTAYIAEQYPSAVVKTFWTTAGMEVEVIKGWCNLDREAVLA